MKIPSELSQPKKTANTIEQLEGVVWQEITCGSAIAKRIHAIRKIPIRLLSDEELRLCLRQQVGLPWTLALTIERLADDPLRHGVFGSGDLLIAAMNLPKQVWNQHEPYKRALLRIADAARLRAPKHRRMIDSLTAFRETF